MNAEARLAQACRDTASELDCIGSTQADFVSKAFHHLADFIDGREPSTEDGRRQRARGAVNKIITHYGWFIPAHLIPEAVIDEIIDAVDLA